MLAMSVTRAALESPGISSIRTLQRQLSALMPSAGLAGALSDGPSLEVSSSPLDLPRLISAVVIEGNALRARKVEPAIAPGFSAFLDGTQESRVLSYAHGMPLIHGKVAAVIRIRSDRRLATWRHTVAQRLYAPRRLLSAQWNATLDALAIDIVDVTSAPDAQGGAAVSEHPFAIRDAAIHSVQADRERVEHRLAEKWCDAEHEPLFVDGGISGSDRVARTANAVGVVKTHRTLYAEGDSLQVVFGLREGERTSVFRITSPKRTSVASWYLRLRDPSGRDPMWGLVRVEIADSGDTEAEIRRRADEVSGWVLAE
ncbi:MAG TPA: hypothetical protein VK636_02345, partial [Gemmatimonadaceae bacterium]|nr:hypothetical protein [Gemmatimonadaceae bacterium]